MAISDKSTMQQISAEAAVAAICFLLVINILSLIASFCVIIFYIRRKARKRYYLLIIYVLTEVLRITSLSWMQIISLVAKEWKFGEAGCIAYGFWTMFLSACTVVTLAALTFDLMLLITKRQLYHRSLYKIGMVISIVFFTFLISSVPLFGWNRFGYEGYGLTCAVDYKDASLTARSSIVFLYLFLCALPLTLIISSFVLIYRQTVGRYSIDRSLNRVDSASTLSAAASSDDDSSSVVIDTNKSKSSIASKKASKTSMKSAPPAAGNSNLYDDITSEIPGLSTIRNQRRFSVTNYMLSHPFKAKLHHQSQRRQQSNAALVATTTTIASMSSANKKVVKISGRTKLQSTLHLTTTALAVAIVVFVCWLPYALSILFIQFGSISTRLVPSITEACLLITFLSSALCPLIFAFREDKIRRHVGQKVCDCWGRITVGKNRYDRKFSVLSLNLTEQKL